MSISLLERITPGKPADDTPKILDALHDATQLNIPEAIDVMIDTLGTKEDLEDTVKLALDELSEQLANRIEEDRQDKKAPSTEIGLHAVHAAVELSLQEPRDKQFLRLATTAIRAFPGVAGPTLQSAFKIARDKNIPFYEAIDKANEERLAS